MAQHPVLQGIMSAHCAPCLQGNLIWPQPEDEAPDHPRKRDLHSTCSAQKGEDMLVPAQAAAWSVECSARCTS